MPLTKCTTPVDNITKIGTTAFDRKMTTPEFKKEFDKSVAGIKEYLNNTLTPELESTAAGASGADKIGSSKLKENGTETVGGQLKELYIDKVDKIPGKGLSANDFKDEDVQALANKVDKIPGKGLSTNDFTNIYKTKLEGIAENANNYSLPIASSSVLGGIKIGVGLEVLQDGTVNGVSAPAPDLIAREQISQEITNRKNADTEINQSISTLNKSLSQVSSIKTPGGTATAIVLDTGELFNGYTTAFIASANNNGTATTINEKPLYKPNTTIAPTLVSGKAYTVWYNTAASCFFIKASAEGTAVAGDVLAGKTFSNNNDTGIVGAMADNGAIIKTLVSGEQFMIPQGYHNGSGKIAAPTIPTPKSYELKSKSFTFNFSPYRTFPASTTGLQTSFDISSYIDSGYLFDAFLAPSYLEGYPEQCIDNPSYIKQKGNLGGGLITWTCSNGVATVTFPNGDGFVFALARAIINIRQWRPVY